jgi:hypothetical protein
MFECTFLLFILQTIGCDFIVKQVPIPNTNYVVELFLYDCSGQSIFNQLDMNTKYVIYFLYLVSVSFPLICCFFGLVSTVRRCSCYHVSLLCWKSGIAAVVFQMGFRFGFFLLFYNFDLFLTLSFASKNSCSRSSLVFFCSYFCSGW